MKGKKRKGKENWKNEWGEMKKNEKGKAVKDKGERRLHSDSLGLN
jgi:hypothetical protein